MKKLTAKSKEGTYLAEFCDFVCVVWVRARVVVQWAVSGAVSTSVSIPRLLPYEYFWRCRKVSEPEEMIPNYQYYIPRNPNEVNIKPLRKKLNWREGLQQLAMNTPSESLTTGNRRRLSMYTP